MASFSIGFGRYSTLVTLDAHTRPRDALRGVSIGLPLRGCLFRESEQKMGYHDSRTLEGKERYVATALGGGGKGKAVGGPGMARSGKGFDSPGSILLTPDESVSR